jgi:hypothetical protein
MMFSSIHTPAARKGKHKAMLSWQRRILQAQRYSETFSGLSGSYEGSLLSIELASNNEWECILRSPFIE